MDTVAFLLPVYDVTGPRISQLAKQPRIPAPWILLGMKHLLLVGDDCLVMNHQSSDSDDLLIAGALHSGLQDVWADDHRSSEN